MALTFTSEGARKAAADLSNSAKNIESMLVTFEELINSVNQNYQSEASQTVVESFNKVKEKGPEFQEAITACARYLSETVAPAYEKVEKSAEDTVTQ